MIDASRNIVEAECTIREAIEVIERSDAKIALLVDGNGVLVASVTDGDVRRGLLRGVTADAQVSEVMHRNPRVVHIDDDRALAMELIADNVCRYVPVVDSDGRVKGVYAAEEALARHKLKNPVLLMAGGRGVRLRPLTDSCPKPMLRVGEKPILQVILESLRDQGFHDFYISVSYLSHMIRDHFEDGSQLGVSITYVDEDSPRGTAGPLALLPSAPLHPIIVINGDILTTVNARALLDFHHDHDATATMCVREYSVEVPFGVVQVSQNQVRGIMEKPVHRHLVNAGIYVLNPEAVKRVPADQAYDMPTLFQEVMAAGEHVCAFPVREYWLDVGRMDDLERAKAEYGNLFLIEK